MANEASRKVDQAMEEEIARIGRVMRRAEEERKRRRESRSFSRRVLRAVRELQEKSNA